MSKRAKQAALKAYPYSPSEIVAYDRSETIEVDGNLYGRAKYLEGYEQAEKDILERLEKQINLWMPDNPEGDEYVEGERLAFRSVLALLKEMED